MGQTIQIRRGNAADLPILLSGEPGLALDTGELYVGTPTGNVKVTGSGGGVSLIEKPINYADKNKMVLGYADQTNGNVVSNSACYLSDFIPVEEGMTFITNGTWFSAYYDASKKFVQTLLHPPNLNTANTVPVGKNIAFARVAFEKNNQYPTAMFVRSALLPSTFVPFSSVELNYPSNVLADIKKQLGQSPVKKVNVIGDSISTNDYATKNWWQYLFDEMGWKTVRNYSVSGVAIGKKSGGDTTCISTTYTNMDNDADLVIVFAGVNDVDYNVPLGVASDRLKDTFYGACHVLFSGLIDKYPSKKIALITQLKREGGATKQLPYVNAYKEVSQFYGLPLLDVYNNGGFYPDNAKVKTALMPDGLHLNALGQRSFADKVKPFILSI